MLAFIGAFSPWHLLLVSFVALLLFGNRLPEVARSLGRAVNEFKGGLREVQDEVRREQLDRSDPPSRKLKPPPKGEDVRARDSEAEKRSER